MRSVRRCQLVGTSPERSILCGLQVAAPRRCGEHVAVHGRDKYLNLLACGGVALGSQRRPMPPRIADGNTPCVSMRPAVPSIGVSGALLRGHPHAAFWVADWDVASLQYAVQRVRMRQARGASADSLYCVSGPRQHRGEVRSLASTRVRGVELPTPGRRLPCVGMIAQGSAQGRIVCGWMF